MNKVDTSVDLFLLSDEQIIAMFTAKQHGFHQWQTKVETSLLDSHIVDDRVYRSLFRERFPLQEDRNEFYAWSDLWNGRHRRRMYRPMTPFGFIQLVQGTDFRRPDSIAKLTWQMGMGTMPFLFLGQSNHGGTMTGYGIRPGGSYLWPNLDEGPDDVDILHRGVLGINFNVRVIPTPASAPNRRLQARVDSAASDDANHGGGFTFAQIGALYVFGEDWNQARQQGIERVMGGNWRETGFGVVVEVDPYGRLGAIWVIWGVYAPDEDDTSQRGERMPMLDNEGSLLPDVGRLYPGAKTPFMVAKIANNLEALKSPPAWNGLIFTNQIAHECQLVRAKLVGNVLLRQYIARSNGQYMYC